MNTAGGVGHPIEASPKFFDDVCNMLPSIVVLKDHFVMSFGILSAFELQCSAQLHQLFLVTLVTRLLSINLILLFTFEMFKMDVT